MKIKEIRQSPNWAKYLKTLGWETHTTTSNINIEAMNLKLGTVVKIQRPKSLNKKDLQEIEDICKKIKALLIKIEPSIGQDENILCEKGYVKSKTPLLSPSTVYIDLRKSEEDLWKEVSRSGKYSTKRARRQGVYIETYKNPKTEKVKEFYEILKHTGKRKKFYVQSFEDIKSKVDIFKDESFLVMAFDKEKNLACANLYLGYKKTVWYMHGGSYPKSKKSLAGYELMWKSFLYFKKQGYEILDLEGKDDHRFRNFTKTWGGFSHFKGKFGGTTIEFPYPYIKYLNPILKKISKVIPLNL